MALIDRFRKGLSKSRKNLSEKVSSAIKRHPKIDDLFWEEIEEALVSADVGFEATMQIVEKLKVDSKKQRLKESSDIQSLR